jgi:urate oxidase
MKIKLDPNTVMKNLIILFIFLCLFLLDMKLQAAGRGSRTNAALLVKGRLNNVESKAGETYTVELITACEVVQSLEVSDNKSFKLLLEKDTHYAIRITKDGYTPRLLSIYTRLPEDDDRLHHFRFDTELIAEEDADTLDKDAIDFPVAVISYDEDIDGFYYNEEYTANIKKQLYTGTNF